LKLNTASQVANRWVRTKDSIPKGKLCLVAVTPSCYLTKMDLKGKMMAVPSAARDCGVAFVHPKNKLEVRAYMNPKIQKSDAGADIEGQVPKAAVEEILAPFWLVSATNDQNAANMTIHLRTEVVGDGKRHPRSVCIPVMENTKVLPANTELCFYRAPNSTQKCPLESVAKTQKLS
jgi:hypothetical protein